MQHAIINGQVAIAKYYISRAYALPRVTVWVTIKMKGHTKLRAVVKISSASQIGPRARLPWLRQSPHSQRTSLTFQECTFSIQDNRVGMRGPSHRWFRIVESGTRRGPEEPHLRFAVSHPRAPCIASRRALTLECIRLDKLSLYGPQPIARGGLVHRLASRTHARVHMLPRDSQDRFHARSILQVFQADCSSKN